MAAWERDLKRPEISRTIKDTIRNCGSFTSEFLLPHSSAREYAFSDTDGISVYIRCP